MSPVRRLLLSCVLLAACGVAVATAPRVGLVTVLDGDATLLRDDGKLAVAEGIALQAGDILLTGPQTRFLRVETPAGLSIAFGPDTRVLLEPHLAGDASGAAIYVLAGWVKLNAPKAATAAVASPQLQATTTGGTAVLTLQPAAAMVFAESGQVQLQSRPAGGVAQTLQAGQMLTLGAAGARPELSPRPTPAFVQAMPRTFMDSLPPRAAAFQGKDVVPKSLGTLTYADAQPWLDAEPALRKAFVKRWRGRVHDTEFRRGLVAGLKSHPEWEPVLYPPVQVPRPASSGAATR